MTDWLDWVQWPAFGASVVAAWLIGSTDASRRKAGFWVFLVSNGLWVAWGLHTQALALIALQVCLAGMNIRGVRKADDDAGAP